MKLSTFSTAGILLFSLAIQAAASGRCVFNAPYGWDQNSTRWDGECREGYADGLGVLKEFRDGTAKRFFFGRMKDGNLDFGVIDQPEGYMAGRFAQGHLEPSEDRQNFISAFDEAEKAATRAATRFREAGNAASARFYETKAKELREQMD